MLPELREEILNQRKDKFLNIGKTRSFTVFSSDKDGLLKSSNFLINIKEKILKEKLKFFIILGLIILVGLFII